MWLYNDNYSNADSREKRTSGVYDQVELNHPGQRKGLFRTVEILYIVSPLQKTKNGADRKKRMRKLTCVYVGRINMHGMAS